jgi:hypothetical protein
MKTLAQYTNHSIYNATFGCLNKLLSFNYIFYIDYNNALDNEHRRSSVK